MENNAKLIINSLSDNVGLARITVASFAAQIGFTLAEIEEIKVAISEAVSNSIIHGYKDNSGKIDIEMYIHGEILEVVVIDRGCGIENIEMACEPAYSTADRMGLGLVFIDSFMDTFKIESKIGEGTKLRMIKRPSQDRMPLN